MAWLPTDSFDSYSDGALNTLNGGSGWNGGWTSDADFTVQGSVTQGGAKAIKYTAGTGDKKAYRLFGKSYKASIFTGYLRKDGAESIIEFVFFDGGITTGSGGSGDNAIRVGMASSTQPSSHGGTIYLTGTTTVDLAASYSISTFYKVEVEFDGDGARARARLNGGSWSSWVTMENSKTKVDRMALMKSSSNSPTPDSYFDSIQGEDITTGASTNTSYPDADAETFSFDGYCITSAGATWDDARAATTSASTNDSGALLSTIGVTRGGGGNYYNTRGFVLFDTSGIGTGTVVGATLSLYATYSLSTSGDETYDYISIVETSPTSNTSIASGDIDNIRGVDGNIPIGSGIKMKELIEADQRADIDTISIAGYTDFRLNNYGLAVVNTTGITKLGVTTGFDIENAAYGGGVSTDEIVSFHSAENASGTSKAPKLTVQYIPAGAASAVTAIFFGIPF